MPHVTLPGGGWADIRENIQKAPRRLFKAVAAVQVEIAALPAFAAMRGAAEGADAQDAAASLAETMDPAQVGQIQPLIEKLREAQIIAMVTAWSYQQPVTVDALDELPEEVFEALAAAVDAQMAPAAAGSDLMDPTREPVGSNA